MQPVDMSMYQVEFAGLPGHRFQQRGRSCSWIRARPTEAKRAGPNRMQSAAGSRISAREQGHLMSKLDEFVDQPGDYPLRAAIEFRRNAFGQWGDLCNAHKVSDPGQRFAEQTFRRDQC